MTKAHGRTVLLLFLTVVASCAGLGVGIRALFRWLESTKQLVTKHDLQCIVLAYHNFHSDRGRGPHNADELLAYEDPYARSLPGNAETQSVARKALQSGNYVVIWDVEILLPPERNSGKVFAYHRDVPERGGMVCYQDLAVAVLTREEFERAPKSQPAADPKKRAEPCGEARQAAEPPAPADRPRE